MKIPPKTGAKQIEKIESAARTLSNAIAEAKDLPSSAREALFCQCDVLSATIEMLWDRDQMIKEIYVLVSESKL